MPFRVKEWFPDLSDEKIELLKLYNDEITKFSNTISLVSQKTLPFMDLIHFSDSIYASRMISLKYKIPQIYDIGSGNGFPGIVYAVLNPTTKVVLVDTDQRKSEFLKHVVATLKLTNASVVNDKIENVPERSIHYAISRGFASLTKSLITCRKSFPKNGIYFHMKGDSWATEISEMPAQICSYWAPELLGEYKLPGLEPKFVVVKTVKISDQ